MSKIKPKLRSHIICVPAELFDGRKGGFCEYQLKEEDIILAQRNMLENNYRFRQVLPVKVFLHQGKVWAYRRTESGSEEGLHDQISVAVGGHWDFEDIALKEVLDEKGSPVGSVIDVEKSLKIAVEREMREEVNLTSEVLSIKALPKVLVADDTEVDRKHFALISIVELDGEGLDTNENELDPLGFVAPSELLENNGVKYELETWARFMCELLLDFEKPGDQKSSELEKSSEQKSSELEKSDEQKSSDCDTQKQNKNNHFKLFSLALSAAAIASFLVAIATNKLTLNLF